MSRIAIPSAASSPSPDRAILEDVGRTGSPRRRHQQCFEPRRKKGSLVAGARSVVDPGDKHLYHQREQLPDDLVGLIMAFEELRDSQVGTKPTSEVSQREHPCLHVNRFKVMQALTLLLSPIGTTSESLHFLSKTGHRDATFGV
ncbi:hypothetical protein AXG93_406s1230 [Marchantia polymorpha subsp. ruderalis]|uniref:Uncharacterized protein n=1 Tax=Marchantia polymorpha subsp. ruderalis TaxID=1480154 RepID=A0A176VDT5_MARPO|nr:hypothetical protein AXG93_406s1230 [Marchantia polymorpha subsp. ruderalis]